VLAFAALIQLGLGGATLERLDLPAWAAISMLVLIVAFRPLSLRLGVMTNGRVRQQRLPQAVQQAVLRWRAPFAEHTAISLDVGGAIVPLCFAVYALWRDPLSSPQLLFASVVVAGVTEFGLRSMLRNTGRVPVVLRSPACAVLLGWALGAEHRAALTCASGLAGILTGADLLHLPDLRYIGAAKVVIGDDASFDAVFVNQMASLLLS
jgi:uncharacterized membrane protein